MDEVATAPHSPPTTESPLFTPPPSPNPGLPTGDRKVAQLNAPNIPGLLYLDHFLTQEETHTIVDQIAACNYFDAALGRDQVVLFGGRDHELTDVEQEHDAGEHALPEWAEKLLKVLKERLSEEQQKAGAVTDEMMSTLFTPSMSSTQETQGLPHYTRQFILNLYRPGQGIAAHIDIPHRFLDGIMILSFGTGIAMDFQPNGEANWNGSHSDDGYSIYLQPGSLCILTGESRWSWTHGIAARESDWVATSSAQSRLVPRGFRLSITIRWLKIQPEMMEQSQANEDKEITQYSLRS